MNDSNINVFNIELLKEIEKLKSDNTILKTEIERLKNLVYLDSLTGLFNRRSLETKEFNEELDAVVMLDLDNFKNFNDKYGHDVGDKILQFTGQLLKNHTRETDLAIRWGGEEFIMIFKNCGENIAYQKAENIRNELENFSVSKLGIKVTASFGVSVGGYLKDLISQADEATYISKRDGKNRVTSYENLKKYISRN